MSENTKIEWCDVTWNTSNGCLHGCPWCYARRMVKRFPKRYPNGFTPTLDLTRLTLPLSIDKPSRIFVNSMGDTFGHWQTNDYLDKLMDVIAHTPQHRYLFLTKNPSNMDEMLTSWCDRHRVKLLPRHIWCGVSITGAKDAHKISLLDDYLSPITDNLFVSVEPLIGDVVNGQKSWEQMKWVIVGAQTPVNQKTFPVEAWIRLDQMLDDLMEKQRAAQTCRTRVFLKGSMKKVMHYDEPFRQEFPADLNRTLDGMCWL